VIIGLVLAAGGLLAAAMRLSEPPRLGLGGGARAGSGGDGGGRLTGVPAGT
jgi:hypothetical protein